MGRKLLEIAVAEGMEAVIQAISLYAAIYLLGEMVGIGLCIILAIRSLKE